MAEKVNNLIDIDILRKKTETADPPPACVTGRIVTVTADAVTVDFSGAAQPQPAATIVDVDERDAGRAVLLSFDMGDRRRPVILGFIRQKNDGAAARERLALRKEQIADIQVDGERLVLSAAREIVIQCGQASLTMTKDGKVVIKGNKIVSRSRGVNKIKGAAVSIN